MKLKIACVAVAFFLFLDGYSQVLAFEQALQAKKISASIKSNPSGTHYSKPLLITITNLGGVEIAVKLAPGVLFQPEDSFEQRLIVVDEMMVSIPSNGTKTLICEGMCTQSDHRSGSAKTIYRCVGMAPKPEWVEWAKFIRSNKLFEIAGQQGMWCLTNPESHSPYNIDGMDSAMSMKCGLKLCELLKINPKPVGKKGKRWETIEVDTLWFDGQMSFNYHEKHKITIGMFNKQGMVVKELYYNEAELPGKKEIKYAFGLGSFPEDEYFVKLLVDGEVKLDKKIDLRSFRE